MSAPIPFLGYGAFFISYEPGDPADREYMEWNLPTRMQWSRHDDVCAWSFAGPVLSVLPGSGTVTVGVVPPPMNDRVSLTSDRVGDTLRLGDMPLKLLAFAPGMVHLQCPVRCVERLKAAGQYYFRDSMWLGCGEGSSGVLGIGEYEAFRNCPEMDYRAYRKFRKAHDFSDVSDDVVLLLRNRYDAGELVLEASRPVVLEDRVVARRIGFTADGQEVCIYSAADEEVPGIREVVVPPYFLKGGTEGFADRLAAYVFTGLMNPPEESGRVVLQLMIGVDGGVESFEILQGTGAVYREKVARALKHMEKERWVPASRNGVATSMTVVVPLNFAPGYPNR